MKLSLLFLLTIFSCFRLNAQHKDFKLHWVNQKNIALHDGEPVFVPGFSGQHFNYYPKRRKIMFSAQWVTSGEVTSATLSQITYAPISEKILNNLDIKAIPNQPELTIQTAQGGQKNYTILYLTPIVNDHGVFKKITSFRVDYILGRKQSFALATSGNTAKRNSVLATGDFFKFYVERTGVYKLTKDFLKRLGMKVNAINPQNIKIYGHGGQMLPLLNKSTKFYDPPQTSIQVFAGNDGQFDAGDYILFYGNATQGNWNEDSKTNLNLYAQQSYYYITASGAPGKRIQAYTPPTGSPTTTITTFDDRAFYEVDKFNIGKVGRRWFGDRFDVQHQKTYDFNFPHIVPGSPLRLEIYAASTSETNTALQVNVNNQNAGALYFAPITDLTFARYDKLTTSVPAQSDQVTVKLNYRNNGNPASIAYLDYLNVYATRQLIAGNKQFPFTYKKAATLSGIGQYHLKNTQNITQIWDVTNPQNISRIPNVGASQSIKFKAYLGETRKYIAIAPADYYTPKIPTHPRFANVNLKGNIFKGTNGRIDYLIITTQALLHQATRLAQHRKQYDNLLTKVVLAEDIYTEFNSGKQDIAALRNFVKYVYDNTPNLQYLLLFGDASVDYKNRLSGNNNIIPTYESLFSYSLGDASTASDDFFGMMNPTEGDMDKFDKLDIAVGRILTDNSQTAKTLVDKIIAYDSRPSFGAWRNNFILISDDADDNTDAQLQFTLDAVGDSIAQHKPFINVNKIHSDAYQQTHTSGGERYPDVNKAITDHIEIGATVVNYLGHGGEDGLASEFIVTRNDIKNWTNEHKLNVFMTVTCEFTRFDNPLRVSPGELTLLNDHGGSVALISTTRAIPISTGIQFNQTLMPYLFNFKNNNYSIGEAVMRAKNSLSNEARHVIFYFGDPAMHLALPDPKVKLTTINGQAVGQDTLKALSKVKVAGKIVSANGALLQNYNGSLTATVYDKPTQRHTLGNDGTTKNGHLVIMDYKTLGNVIFRGKASVKNGAFAFEFVVPKDIKMDVGHGRISLYATQDNKLQDNRGYTSKVPIGGLNKDAPKDNKGPEIRLYLNDETFISGGITNDSPLILAHLEDKNGINIAGGIGHDIIAYIDGDKTHPYVLNDYYKAKEDMYTKGTVNYKLRDLEKGLHTLTFKAWDVYNNSSTAEIQFVVAGDDELKITHVLNYPNPFHDYTEFWFHHNRPFEPLQVQVQVFTVSGKLVWSTNRVITTEGFLSRDITWNGRDQFGNPLAKGVYIYKLTVKSTLTDHAVEKYEKLVIL